MIPKYIIGQVIYIYSFMSVKKEVITEIKITENYIRYKTEKSTDLPEEMLFNDLNALKEEGLKDLQDCFNKDRDTFFENIKNV